MSGVVERLFSIVEMICHSFTLKPIFCVLLYPSLHVPLRSPSLSLFCITFPLLTFYFFLLFLSLSLSLSLSFSLSLLFSFYSRSFLRHLLLQGRNLFSSQIDMRGADPISKPEQSRAQSDYTWKVAEVPVPPQPFHYTPSKSKFEGSSTSAATYVDPGVPATVEKVGVAVCCGVVWCPGVSTGSRIGCERCC